jgi:hypothetical protein
MHINTKVIRITSASRHLVHYKINAGYVESANRNLPLMGSRRMIAYSLAFLNEGDQVLI